MSFNLSGEGGGGGPAGAANLVGPAADLLALTPTGSGQIYFCDDMPLGYIDDPVSSTWQSFRARVVPPPPLAASYTYLSSHLSLDQAGPSLVASLINSQQDYGVCALVPAGSLFANPYAVELEVIAETLYNLNYFGLGVCVANGVTEGVSNFHMMLIHAFGGSGGITPAEQAWTLAGARTELNYQSIQIDYGQSFTGDRTIRVRILGDGALTHYQYSVDGFKWVNYWTGPNLTGQTHYGIASGSSGGPASSNYTSGIVTKNQARSIVATHQRAISSATNGTPIAITTTAAHNLRSGDIVSVAGCLNAAANTGGSGTFGPLGAGAWVVVTGPTTFNLLDHAGGAAVGAGGTVTLLSR